MDMQYLYDYWQFVNVEKQNQGGRIRHEMDILQKIALFVEVKCSFSFNANSQGSKLRSKSLLKSGVCQLRDSANVSETGKVTYMFSIHTVLLDAYIYFHVFK